MTFKEYLYLGAAIASFSWGAHAYIGGQLEVKADKEYVMAMNQRQLFFEDRQFALLIREIAYYEAKESLTTTELAHLNWLREQLAEMMRVRRQR